MIKITTQMHVYNICFKYLNVFIAILCKKPNKMIFITKLCMPIVLRNRSGIRLYSR